jgi:hypothetical protein
LRGFSVGVMMGGIFKYAVEMASGDMINIPSFIKSIQAFGSYYRKGNTQKHTHIQQGDLMSIFLFFLIKKIF